MAYSGIFMKIITIRLIIFERNDLSSIILTLIAISLFILGKYIDGLGFMFNISIEITLYGLAYFFYMIFLSISDLSCSCVETTFTSQH